MSAFQDECPMCGQQDVIYHGVDDGGGDYGDSVCDQYECETCGHQWEENCMGGGDYEGIGEGETKRWYADIKASIKALLTRYPFRRHDPVDDIPF